MSHDYHEGLPGYSERQVLTDQCGECESRAVQPDVAINAMDVRTFVRAWARATEWNRHGLNDLSRAEMPTLKVLWSMQLKLEELGVPLGQIPVVLNL